MEELYAKEGSERQTDEFMKPIILNKEGLIRGMHNITVKTYCYHGLYFRQRHVDLY